MKISKTMKFILVAILAISFTCMIGKNSETKRIIKKKPKEEFTYIFQEEYILGNNFIQRKESQELIIDIPYIYILPKFEGIETLLITYNKETEKYQSYFKKIIKNEEIYKNLSKLEEFDFKVVFKSNEIKNFEKTINTKTKTITTYNKFYNLMKNTSISSVRTYSNLVMNIVLKENTLIIYVDTSGYELVQIIGDIKTIFDKETKNHLEIDAEELIEFFKELDSDIESNKELSVLIENLEKLIKTKRILSKSQITFFIDSFIEILDKEEFNLAKNRTENKKFENSPTITEIYNKINNKFKKAKQISI